MTWGFAIKLLAILCCNNSFIFIFIRAFSLLEAAGTQAPVRLKIPHGIQQSQTVLLVLGTTQCRKFNHSTSSLVGLWVSFTRVLPTRIASPSYSGKFWKCSGTNVAAISPIGLEVSQPPGSYECHSCALCFEVSHVNSSQESHICRFCFI